MHIGLLSQLQTTKRELADQRQAHRCHFAKMLENFRALASFQTRKSVHFHLFPAFALKIAENKKFTRRIVEKLKKGEANSTIHIGLLSQLLTTKRELADQHRCHFATIRANFIVSC